MVNIKVGDRVQAEVGDVPFFDKEDYGVVTRAEDPHSYEVDFKGQHNKRVEGDGCWWINPARLTLAPLPTPTARANDPVTSKGKRRVNVYEQVVIKSLSFTPAGRTGQEIANDEEHPLNCITPRFAPLRRKGLIKDSGVRRDKQIVWVLA